MAENMGSERGMGKSDKGEGTGERQRAKRRQTPVRKFEGKEDTSARMEKIRRRGEDRGRKVDARMCPLLRSLPHSTPPVRNGNLYAQSTGVNVINVGKTYEKIVLAARILAAIENPADVCVISARPYGHRAVLKYAGFTGANAIAGRLYVQKERSGSMRKGG